MPFVAPVTANNRLLAGVAVSLASYLILRISARGARWLSPIMMSIAIRIMGLLLAAVAIQFMLNAIRAFRLDLLGLPPN